MEGFLGSKEPYECRNEEGDGKVSDTVRYPCDDVKYRMSEPCQDVGNIRAEQNRLEGR